MIAYYLRLSRDHPREAAYVLPRRIACRILRRHNITCLGRQDHPRRRR